MIPVISKRKLTEETTSSRKENGETSMRMRRKSLRTLINQSETSIMKKESNAFEDELFQATINRCGTLSE